MDDEVDLLEYWRVMVKRRRLIITLTLVMAVSALIYSLLQPKMYKATVTIMSVDTGGGGLASALSAMPFLGGMGGVSGGESKLLPILKSRALAKNVAQDLDLAKTFPKLASNEKLSQNEKMQSAAGSLQSAVEVKNVDGLLAISIVWLKPEPAAELANLYVEKLGKFLNVRALNVNFQVIDPAVPPIAKFKPKTKQNVFISAVLGIISGVFVAFFLEFLEKASK